MIQKPNLKNNKNNSKAPQQTNQPTVKIIPLGGLHEIGKNTCVFEFQDEIILLDAGIGFPADDMHGVNIVLPDTTYLEENAHKIKAMIVTHGHEDHIGGIAHHLKNFNIPKIYGPRLAMNLLTDKLEEAGVFNNTKLNSVKPRDVVKLCQYFSVEFIRNTHSIADSFSVAIHTPIGVIIHSGDFKVDHTPVDGEYFDLQRLAEYGEKGVLCLLSDSTNAEVPGHTPSEASVKPNLDRVIGGAEGRVMVTTFASSVHRVNIILQLAQKHRRKVCVVGRSMLNVIAHCRNLGYIKCSDDVFISFRNLRQMKDDQVLILTTGSQGETLAAMTRISRGEHRNIKVRAGDTIVFSANPIPGNTIAVVNTIDRLMMQGAKVVYGKHEGIHVSGHGSQEDHKLMLALTKPKFFMPVHGEHRMLMKHAGMANAMGIPEDNIIILDNGDVVGLTRTSIGIVDQIQSGIKLVDQAGIVHDHIMEERQQLAADGVVTIALNVDGLGKLVHAPEIVLKGITTTANPSMVQQMIRKAIENTLAQKMDRALKEKSKTGAIDWGFIKLEIEASVQRTINRELRSSPLLVVMLHHNEGNSKASIDPVAVEETTPSEEMPKPIKNRRRRPRPSVVNAS